MAHGILLNPVRAHLVTVEKAERSLEQPVLAVNTQGPPVMAEVRSTGFDQRGHIENRDKPALSACELAAPLA